MLIKRNRFMTTPSSGVKKLRAISLAALVTATSAIAPSAFAMDDDLVERTITVKFDRAELATDTGVQTIYKRLYRKSKSACRADRGSLSYFGQSLSECTADLLDQFIGNADIDSLSAYHAIKNGVDVKSFASNMAITAAEK